jgi:hypothetical protein
LALVINIHNILARHRTWSSCDASIEVPCRQYWYAHTWLATWSVAILAHCISSQIREYGPATIINIYRPTFFRTEIIKKLCSSKHRIYRVNRMLISDRNDDGKILASKANLMAATSIPHCLAYIWLWYFKRAKNDTVVGWDGNLLENNARSKKVHTILIHTNDAEYQKLRYIIRL